MYKVEHEFIHYDEDNRIVDQSQHYSYCETLEDAIKCVHYRMINIATTAQVSCLYIWHNGDMIFHTECSDGVWS